MKIQEGKDDLNLTKLEQIFEVALDEFVDASWEEMTGAVIDHEIIKGCYPNVGNIG